MAFLDKMKAAGNVVADLEAYGERRVDALLARGAELRTKADKAFAVHEDRLNVNYDALDRFEHAVDVLGNGAPDGSSAGGTAATGTKTPYDGVNGEKTQ